MLGKGIQSLIGHLYAASAEANTEEQRRMCVRCYHQSWLQGGCRWLISLVFGPFFSSRTRFHNRLEMDLLWKGDPPDALVVLRLAQSRVVRSSSRPGSPTLFTKAPESRRGKSSATRPGVPRCVQVLSPLSLITREPAAPSVSVRRATESGR